MLVYFCRPHLVVINTNTYCQLLLAGLGFTFGLLQHSKPAPWTKRCIASNDIPPSSLGSPCISFSSLLKFSCLPLPRSFLPFRPSTSDIRVIMFWLVLTSNSGQVYSNTPPSTTITHWRVPSSCNIYPSDSHYGSCPWPFGISRQQLWNTEVYIDDAMGLEYPQFRDEVHLGSRCKGLSDITRGSGNRCCGCSAFYAV